MLHDAGSLAPRWPGEVRRLITNWRILGFPQPPDRRLYHREMRIAAAARVEPTVIGEVLLDDGNDLVLRNTEPVACSIAKVEGRAKAKAHVEIAEAANELGELDVIHGQPRRR
jgi:hypothetical protein